MMRRIVQAVLYGPDGSTKTSVAGRIGWNEGKLRPGRDGIDPDMRARRRHPQSDINYSRTKFCRAPPRAESERRAVWRVWLIE